MSLRASAPVARSMLHVPDPRQALELGGPAAVDAALGEPVALDERDDGQLTTERAEPDNADSPLSFRRCAGARAVTVGTGENL